MKKIDLGVIVTTLIIVTISCSLAFFAARVVGEPKDINLKAKNVAITFNDTSIIANGVVSPGWNTTKTFTITNNSKEEYKYNISIKDLINTFVTEEYLQYKITSTNGYNMTEFKDIPKSSAPKDTILAYSVSIPVGVTQSYTIEFKYANDESVDQSEDMGKKLSGTLFITEGTEEPNKTLLSQILKDNPTRNTRDTYDTVFTTDTTGTLFTATEKNVHNKADSNSKKAYAFAIPAVVIALLLIAFIGIALTGSVKKAVKKSAITNNYTEISNKIYSYLDSSSYKELSDYSDEIDALDNKAFDKEYSVLMGVRYYVWSVGFMNTNDSDNYNLTQSDVSNLAYYLSQFYYYTQLSAYKDKEVTMTSDNEKYLNKMREDMGVLLKKYYHITDEDLEAIDTFSSARIEQCLIQRG